MNKNCFFFCFFFNRKYIFKHKVQGQLRNYILYNFIRIIEINKEIFDLPCDDLYDLITDDILNVHAEETVWEFCLRWIEYDEQNRMQFTMKLLQGIRFGLMNLNVNSIEYYYYCNCYGYWLALMNFRGFLCFVFFFFSSIFGIMYVTICM